MPIVPTPTRVPLPKVEPVPATPHGPGEEWTNVNAGDLNVGYIAALSETRHRVYTRTKHLHPGPLGFSAPEKEDDAAAAG